MPSHRTQDSRTVHMVRQAVDPDHEFRHVQVKRRLLQPTGLKTDRAEIWLLPAFDLEQERRKDLRPIALGSLGAYEDSISGKHPRDSLMPILQMLIAGAIQVRLDAWHSVSAS